VSVAGGGYRDEVTVVRDLEVPLAVLHGEQEQLINGKYFETLAMPTLWRGAVQIIPGPGTRRSGRRPEPSTRSLRRSWRKPWDRDPVRIVANRRD
jgi:hypothetical protein